MASRKPHLWKHQARRTHQKAACFPQPSARVYFDTTLDADAKSVLVPRPESCVSLCSIACQSQSPVDGFPNALLLSVDFCRAQHNGENTPVYGPSLYFHRLLGASSANQITISARGKWEVSRYLLSPPVPPRRITLGVYGGRS